MGNNNFDKYRIILNLENYISDIRRQFEDTRKSASTPEHKAHAREEEWAKVLREIFANYWFSKGTIIDIESNKRSASIDLLAIRNNATLPTLKESLKIPFFADEIIFAFECKDKFTTSEMKRLVRQCKSLKILKTGKRPFPDEFSCNCKSHNEDTEHKQLEEFQKIPFFCYFDVEDKDIEKYFDQILEMFKKDAEKHLWPDIFILGSKGLIFINKAYEKALFSSEKKEDCSLSILGFYYGNFAWSLFVFFSDFKMKYWTIADEGRELVMYLESWFNKDWKINYSKYGKAKYAKVK